MSLVLGLILVAAVSTGTEEVRKLDAEARQYLDQKNYELALDRYQRARALMKELPGTEAEQAKVLFLVGFCQEKLGRTEAAVVAYRTASTLARSPELRTRIRSRLLDIESRGVDPPLPASSPSGHGATSPSPPRFWAWAATGASVSMIVAYAITLDAFYGQLDDRDIAVMQREKETDAARRVFFQSEFEAAEDDARTLRGVNYAAGSAAIIFAGMATYLWLTDSSESLALRWADRRATIVVRW